MDDDRDQQPDNPIDRAIGLWRNVTAPTPLPDELAQRMLCMVQTQQQSLRTRITTMLWKAKYPTSAAAAVLIAAFVGWLVLGRGQIAFADVIQKVREAKSVTFNMTMGFEGQPPLGIIQTSILEPGQIRQEMSMPLIGNTINIIDSVKKEGFTLIPALKQAVRFNDDASLGLSLSAGALSRFRRDPLGELFELPAGSVESVREQVVEGRKAKVYRVNKPGASTTVSADAKSGELLRVEITIDMAPLPKQRIVMSDFVWNPELDGSLFTVPEGYTVQEGPGQPGAPDGPSK